MNALQIFNYNNSPISFKNERGIAFINATQMAKSFGKRPIDYLNLPSTVSIINAIVRKSNNSIDQVVITRGGSPNNGGGTWMVETLALDFAQWLSVDFRLWCNDRIKELLKTGSTNLLNFQVPTTFSEALRLAADLQDTNDRQQKQLDEQAPKVLFASSVEASKQSCLISELAKVLTQNGYEIGQNRLFSDLRERGYLCNKGEYYNQPTQRAMELGLFELKKTTINTSGGAVIISTTSKVTGKGLIYFIDHYLTKWQKTA